MIDDVGLIVVSPMRRTLQTAWDSLGFLMRRSVPVIVSPDWTETSTAECDTGSRVDILSTEFPQFSFEPVYPEWPEKTGKYAFTQSAVTARGLECRRWLKNRPEKAIIVVSHADFLYQGICSETFQNAAFRVFDFVGEEDVLKERVDPKATRIATKG